MREETGGMRYSAFFVALLVIGAAPQAHSFCGCDKPPPPRASVRPFMGYTEQTITLFDERIVPGSRYTVQFT